MVLNGDKLKAFPQRLEKRHKCPLPLVIFNIMLEVLDNAIKQEQEIKYMQTGK